MVKISYRNFKNMLPTDKELINEYFKFKTGDVVLSAYGEIIKVKDDSAGREYSKDPYMIPLFTIDLLIELIETLMEGEIVKIEGVEDAIYVSINLDEIIGDKILKGYAIGHDLFNGLFHIFMTLLKEYKG